MPGWLEGLLTDQIFQEAYAKVRARHSDQAWLTLLPREITAFIYQEMREIDLARASEAEARPRLPLAAE